MALRIATPVIPAEKIVAAATGSTGGLGKIGTVAASGTLYARIDLNQGPGPGTSMVDVRVKSDREYSLAFYVARTNVLGGTITLTDATAVDDGDPFQFNGETYTAETTESDAVASARKWYHASQAAGAAALAALLANTTYGVPGIGAITVTAPSTTDVLTIAPGAATVYQFNQLTSDANEIAWSETTLASLTKLYGEDVTGAAANSTTAGTIYRKYVDGWPYLYVGYTNGSGATAANVTIGATLHDSV